MTLADRYRALRAAWPRLDALTALRRAREDKAREERWAAILASKDPWVRRFYFMT